MGRRGCPGAKRRIPTLGRLLGCGSRDEAEAEDPWREYFEEAVGAALRDLEASIAAAGLVGTAGGKRRKYEQGLKRLETKLVGAAARPPPGSDQRRKADGGGARWGAVGGSATAEWGGDAQVKTNSCASSSAGRSCADAPPSGRLGHQEAHAGDGMAGAGAPFGRGGRVGSAECACACREVSEKDSSFGGCGEAQRPSKCRSIGNWSFVPESRARAASRVSCLRATERRTCAPGRPWAPSAGRCLAGGVGYREG